MVQLISVQHAVGLSVSHPPTNFEVVNEVTLNLVNDIFLSMSKSPLKLLICAKNNQAPEPNDQGSIISLVQILFMDET